MKKSIGSALTHLGLARNARQIREVLRGRSHYRSIKTFSTAINGVSVQFSTEDEFSNSWFYPRYTGGRIHERKVTLLLLQLLQSAKCFVDVGANLGWYTCLASRSMPDGRVYGFEMDDLNYALLEKNVKLNKCTNVEIHNVAVSDVSGVVSYRRENRRPSATFRMEPDKAEKHLPELASVHSITLDEFFESQSAVPDVVKIDVEGAEMYVLNGMKHILRDNKPILLLEVHPLWLRQFNSSIPEILSALMENGYKVFEIRSMRDQQAEPSLKPLSRASALRENTMLYARA